eukprot:TRINITY_DN68901_c0_g1_i1.p1 TRINITY_DN68901_c0_g1~~TRINITY_DN68901_c0_g1_i1.p1  ORF type:complete len:707 (-),score=182.65 TRINITY_DN68901_c0_g1_i1:38-2062(-)
MGSAQRSSRPWAKKKRAGEWEEEEEPEERHGGGRSNPWSCGKRRRAAEEPSAGSVADMVRAKRQKFPRGFPGSIGEFVRQKQAKRISSESTSTSSSSAPPRRLPPPPPAVPVRPASPAAAPAPAAAAPQRPSALRKTATGPARTAAPAQTREVRPKEEPPDASDCEEEEERQEASEEAGEEPFWLRGEAFVQEYESESGDSKLWFQATLVMPRHMAMQELDEGAQLPIVFYFAGLGTHDRPFEELRPSDVAPLLPEPIILVVCHRPVKKWWTISTDGAWGWVDGDFLPKELERISNWMEDLIQTPKVDAGRVCIMGYSAGAYMVSELVAGAPVTIQRAAMGGVHGHGQPDLEDIQGKHRRDEFGDEIKQKWANYTLRLDNHAGVPGGIYMAHHPKDQYCRYELAEDICQRLDRRQAALDFPQCLFHKVTTLDTCKKRDARSAHSYFRPAFLTKKFWRWFVNGDDVILDSEEPEEPEAPVHAAAASSSSAAPRRKRPAGVWNADAQQTDMGDADQLKDEQSDKFSEDGHSGGTQAQEDDAADQEEAIGPGSVRSISARIGWYVDHLALELRDGSMLSYGRHSGNDMDPIELEEKDRIVAVEQKLWSVGYLGAYLCFHLHGGREVTISGEWLDWCSKKKKPQQNMFHAPPGCQVVGLTFEGSMLTGLLTAPFNVLD